MGRLDVISVHQILIGVFQKTSFPKVQKFLKFGSFEVMVCEKNLAFGKDFNMLQTKL